MKLVTAIVFLGAHGFAGVDLGTESGEVVSALARECAQVETLAVAPPRTPLAARTEVRLRCRGYLGGGGVKDADFLIADGELSMVELRGQGVADWVRAQTSADPTALGDFAVFADDRLVLNEATGRAFVIDAGDLRSYAFLQSDPFADSNEATDSGDAERPPELPMGEKLETVKSSLSAACSSLVVRDLDPASHPFKPARHVQIDCYGYDFLGFPRLVEAVFADDELTHAWILTTAQEEERNRAALVARYGEALRSDDAFEVYDDGTVALRKDDNPEVLFMSEPMADFFASNMQGQGG